MSLINIKNLTFGYDGSQENVFEDVSLCLDTDWRLGLAGRNGKGKTTLLRLLAGELIYRGRIDAAVGFDYFPFETDPNKPAEEAFARIFPNLEGWRVRRELGRLEADDDLLCRPFGSLSKGEQTKVRLAVLFSRENRFLLIDEPTDNLDYIGRQAVSRYLAAQKGFIVVSHDRAFLDGCIDHILTLNRTNIEVQKGNFSSWDENKRRRDEFERNENEKLKKEIDRLSESARRACGWSDAAEKTKYGTRNSGLRPDRGFIGHKSAKMMKRAKAFESRQTEAAEQKSRLLKNVETADELRPNSVIYFKSIMIEARELSAVYGSRRTAPVSFTLSAGDRIALTGKNGCGKSSLLKILTGESDSYAGRFCVGSRLKISYVPQDTDFLRGSLREYAANCGVDESLFKALLAKLDFNKAMFEADMASYSMGQKKKVLLARSLSEPAHIYLWDEPLNYVDVVSRQQIENMITTFRPTMIFVEHDSSFYQNAATKIIHID